jgi:SAM-dependent methyltransferase
MPERDGADLEALSDLCTPWCVHAAATLRVADHIAAGTTGIDDLAAAAGCDSESLARLLRHLVGKGVFQEPAPGRFALNDAAQGLRDPSRRAWLDLDAFGGRVAHAWSGLLTAVRTGKPAYRELFGRAIWEDLDAHPDIAASFDALMGPPGHGTPDPEVLVTGEWEDVRTVVDVGGGTGALLAEILRTRPHVHGTLVDLPRVIARAGEVLGAAGVAERATTVAQSFFDPLPAGADLYLLKSVLNDWPDGAAAAILRGCAEAARPGGRVVVLGGVSPEGHAAGAGAAPALLEMVLLGGRDRTVAELRELAGRARLAVWAAGWQPSGRFVVECRPA